MTPGLAPWPSLTTFAQAMALVAPSQFPSSLLLGP